MLGEESFRGRLVADGPDAVSFGTDEIDPSLPHFVGKVGVLTEVSISCSASFSACARPETLNGRLTWVQSITASLLSRLDDNISIQVRRGRVGLTAWRTYADGQRSQPNMGSFGIAMSDSRVRANAAGHESANERF